MIVEFRQIVQTSNEDIKIRFYYLFSYNNLKFKYLLSSQGKDVLLYHCPV